jgi:threonine/homoserine efflux transporter RhtA
MASSVIISSPQNKDSFMAVTISLIPFVKLPEVFSSLMTSPALLGKGLALGLVSTFFPFVSYTLGLRQMEAGKASVLAFAEPMVAAVAGIVVFGEMLRVENVLGILLIFTALVVLNSRNVKR